MGDDLCSRSKVGDPESFGKIIGCQGGRNGLYVLS